MQSLNMPTALSRKWATFYADPIGSVEAKARLFPQEQRNFWGRRYLSRLGIAAMVDDFFAQSNGCAPEYGDLWYLYRQVRQRRPRVIWEFGSGCSTVVLAAACKANLCGVVNSMEADAYWHQATVVSFPSNLKPWVNVLHSPAIENEYAGTTQLRHDCLPDAMPDFVYLDGPDLSAHEAAIDLLLIERHLPVGCFIVVDDRKRNTAFLRAHFKRHWRFKRRQLFAQPTFELVGP